MEVNSLSFDVVDPKTGEYQNLEKIALREDWAKGLMYCDMDGFAIMEDGELLLLDDCGNFAYCPNGRFEIHTRPIIENNGRRSMFEELKSRIEEWIGAPGQGDFYAGKDAALYAVLDLIAEMEGNKNANERAN